MEAEKTMLCFPFQERLFSAAAFLTLAGRLVFLLKTIRSDAKRSEKLAQRACNH